MKIVVIANIEAQKEFESKGVAEGIEAHFEAAISEVDGADAYFYLKPEKQLLDELDSLQKLGKPVFANAVITTLSKLPLGFVRINGYPGSLERSVVEICASDVVKQDASTILEALGWKYEVVPDIPGMVTARTIAMIINEAYFALGDEVSTKEEIDIAMKLGTNYPYGPFEWAEKIGLQNIADLLTQLSESEPRYACSPALLKETTL